MKSEDVSTSFPNRCQNANEFVGFDFQTIQLPRRQDFQSFDILQPKLRLIGLLQRNTHFVRKVLSGSPTLRSSIIGRRRAGTTDDLTGSVPGSRRNRHSIGHLSNAKRKRQKSLTELIVHDALIPSVVLVHSNFCNGRWRKLLHASVLLTSDFIPLTLRSAAIS